MIIRKPYSGYYKRSRPPADRGFLTIHGEERCDADQAAEILDCVRRQVFNILSDAAVLHHPADRRTMVFKVSDVRAKAEQRKLLAKPKPLVEVVSKVVDKPVSKKPEPVVNPMASIRYTDK